jgi:hypothetical protein
VVLLQQCRDVIKITPWGAGNHGDYRSTADTLNFRPKLAGAGAFLMLARV